MHADRHPDLHCFFCGTGRADREYGHRLLGPRPCCPSCDPANIARQSGDTLARMTGCLVAAATSIALDLGDEREVVENLQLNGYTEDEIALFMERAIEAARRQIQRTASRFHPFADRVAEAAALALVLAVWVVGYVATNPPAQNHRHVYFAQVQR